MLLDLFQGNFNLVEFLIEMLTSLPAFLLAISLHEAAHGYVAMRCGDPTAKMLGRVTINPIKHIDPVGFAMMLLVGVGWAKPVPVNPNHFKNPRRDDLLVSVAGITMNLIQFVAGCLLMYGMVALALARAPESARLGGGYFAIEMEGVRYRMTAQDAFSLAPAMRSYLIAPFLGTVAGYAYEFVVSFAVVNIMLAAFNLLPVPPLDGYHVLNDLVLKRSLFASGRMAQIGRALIYLLAFTGVLGKGLSYVVNGALSGAGNLAYAAFRTLNLI